MTRNPLARYYDFAVQPRHGALARLWIVLPVGVSLSLLFAIAACHRHGLISDPKVLRALVYGSLATALIWFGYVAFRTAVEIFAAGRWVKRNLGPTWTSDWRAALRTLFGRSGKTD